MSQWNKQYIFVVPASFWNCVIRWSFIGKELISASNSSL